MKHLRSLNTIVSFYFSRNKDKIGYIYNTRIVIKKKGERGKKYKYPHASKNPIKSKALKNRLFVAF